MPHRRTSQPFAVQPPAYPFHDRGQRDRFLQLVREHLEQGGQKVLIEAGVAMVEGQPVLHGLTNLAQICHRSPSQAWPALIAEHLAKSDQSKMASIVHDLANNDYAQIAGRLAVRIHPETLLAGAPELAVVHRRDLPGTLTLLVRDVGASTVAVPVPIATAWGVPFAALFERALLNIVALGRVRWMSVPVPPQGPGTIDILHGDYYAASHVLRHAAGLPRIGAFGNLIGVPVRGALLHHALDELTDLRAIEAMLAMTNGMFRDGPGSITPHLYWRTPTGQFLLQQGSCEAGQVRFVPSPEFAELMVRLRGETGSSG